LVTKRPFVSKLVFCQHTTDEILLLTVNISLLFLAILDQTDSTNEVLKDDLGYIIIICNLIFNMTINIYMFSYVLSGLISAYHITKVYKKQGMLAWLTAFLGPFESGGMDLEVIIPVKDDTTTTSSTINKLVTQQTPPSLLLKNLSITPPRTPPDTSRIEKRNLYLKGNDSFNSLSFARDAAGAYEDDLFALNILSPNQIPSTPMSPASVGLEGQLLDISPTKISSFGKRKLISRINSSFHLDSPSSKHDKSLDIDELTLNPPSDRFSNNRTSIMPDYKTSKRTLFRAIHESKDPVSSNIIDNNPSTKELMPQGTNSS